MSSHKSYRKMCPDLIVNDFVTEVIKTVPLRVGYSTIRVTLKSEKSPEKTSGCAVTTLSAVCRRGCLVDIVDVVVKSAPKNTKLRQCVPVKDLFAREAYFHDTILSEFKDFQTDLNVRNEGGFQGAPSLIAASLQEGEEALILQNSGADRAPKYERWVGELTQEHTVAILKELARLHALSFAFGERNPKRCEEFKRELSGGYFTLLENRETLRVIHGNLNGSLNFFEDDVAKRLKKFDGEIDGFLENVLNGEGQGEVLLHGDPSTNFLFCYEKVEVSNPLGSTATSAVCRAKLTDWHLVKFGSPVLDLSVFLFTNSPFDDLTNPNTLLRDYHAFLTLSLQEFRCDSKEFLPYERLEEEWRKYSRFGLVLAFFNFGLLTMEMGKRPDVNDEDVTCEEFLKSFHREPNDEFIRRIKDVVKFCVDNQLI